ncbi:MAG: nitroreductase family protein [Sphaerochaetaceae bacterium]|nr:nitroreductase family protein [Sphaerochaetaceae bacterium]
MQLLEPIQKRRAYRAFDKKKVDTEILTRLAQAAHTAPSSANNQPWRIVTVTEEGQLAKMKEVLAGGNYWGKNAPAVSAFVTSPGWSMSIGGRDLAYFELGMAAMAYQLQAVSEGLYVHPIVGFDAQKAKEVLSIPDEAVLEILMIVGYPGDKDILSEKHLQMEEMERERKPLDQILSWDRWSDLLLPKKK